MTGPSAIVSSHNKSMSGEGDGRMADECFSGVISNKCLQQAIVILDKDSGNKTCWAAGVGRIVHKVMGFNSKYA